ncbi:MAG: hypothetical protein H6Q34_222, partial [Deltaproteobacteria bacterium]|nr:hypothetical protein [Deltaproteobacteria bacterium]
MASTERAAQRDEAAEGARLFGGERDFDEERGGSSGPQAIDLVPLGSHQCGEPPLHLGELAAEP